MAMQAPISGQWHQGSTHWRLLSDAVVIYQQHECIGRDLRREGIAGMEALPSHE
jgi:hypothetical protein